MYKSPPAFSRSVIGKAEFLLQEPTLVSVLPGKVTTGTWLSHIPMRLG